MKSNRQSTSYRRGGFTGVKREQQDPYVFVLSGQIALSLLFVLLAYLLRDAQPSFWQPVREEYIQLLNRPMSSEEWGWNEGLGGWYASWRDRTLDAVSAGVQALTNDRAPQAEEVDAAVLPADSPAQLPQENEPEGEAVIASAAHLSETLTGAGGWFGVAEEMEKVPASCSLAPILLSRQLDAPVTGRVTSLFGWREHPITGERDFHRGLDIAAVAGSKIRAPLPGEVSEVGASDIYGNFITLDHGAGLRTTYAHCDTIEAQAGDKLRAGELVATVGSTGISTGPHLHFEIEKDKQFYNPLWGLFRPGIWQDVKYGA